MFQTECLLRAQLVVISLFFFVFLSFLSNVNLKSWFLSQEYFYPKYVGKFAECIASLVAMFKYYLCFASTSLYWQRKLFFVSACLGSHRVGINNPNSDAISSDLRTCVKGKGLLHRNCKCQKIWEAREGYLPLWNTLFMAHIKIICMCVQNGLLHGRDQWPVHTAAVLQGGRNALRGRTGLLQVWVQTRLEGAALWERYVLMSHLGFSISCATFKNCISLLFV